MAELANKSECMSSNLCHCGPLVENRSHRECHRGTVDLGRNVASKVSLFCVSKRNHRIQRMNFQSHFISYRQPLFCFHSNFLKLRCGMGIRYFRQVTMKYSPNHAAAITSARPILVCSWRHCASICVCCRGIQCQDSRAKSAHVVRSHPSEPDPEIPYLIITQNPQK